MNRTFISCVIICIGLWVLPQAGADVITHIDVDFSSYNLGNVKGQGEGGTWSGGVQWNGTVVSDSSEYPAGTQVLSLWGEAGGTSSARRGWFNPTVNLDLSAPDKIYFSTDLYTTATTPSLLVGLGGTSIGSVPARFLIMDRFNTSQTVRFVTGATADAVQTFTDTSFTPVADTWYRFEYEITQSATTGEGTFSVFVSTGPEDRTAILTDQAYSFVAEEAVYLHFVPNGGTADNPVSIGNIKLQSGLTEFPVNPIPEPATVGLLLAGGIASILTRRMRRL